MGPTNIGNQLLSPSFFSRSRLEGEDWSRTRLAGITREVNRAFPMPVIILFRYGRFVSVSVIDRRTHLRDESRDVIDRKRISIIKDVDVTSPHRAHLDILSDISLEHAKVRGRGTPNNFRDLYNAWLEALSAQELNKRFYRDLANWFLWSTKHVVFPTADRSKTAEGRSNQNQIAIIRLLTRLIFVWFIKEKGLVPDDLFEPSELREILKDDPAAKPDSSSYYKGILQNLFFATLNTEDPKHRKWRTKSSSGKGLDGQYLVHSSYRYKNLFKDSNRALKLLRSIPFLNGGLFECLDREVTKEDLQRNSDLKPFAGKEGKRLVIRVDGFSERRGNPLVVPNRIFFARQEKVDLNKEFNTKGRPYVADGLIELFSRYKFTVEENTPLEEEVALDPELLGKVFENLLASYNEDTRTTARKKSGSFYTPREVVDYMVDEVLAGYFGRCLSDSTEPRDGAGKQARKQINEPLDLGPADGEMDLNRPERAERSQPSPTEPDTASIRNLLSYEKTGNPFDTVQTDLLIKSIEDLRAIDPACGSGAFPMGLLQKLIHVLHRLDPDNARWKSQNRAPLEARLKAAHEIPDPSRRDAEIEEAEAALEKLEEDFSDANRPDYARKLYLIDKCLFGVDIQPIAVQIAKLRFFISLVVSQEIDWEKENANITALPNLETKLVAADSLIPIERGDHEDLFRNPEIAEKEKALREINERYFSARTVKTKARRRGEIAHLRDELAELLQTERGLPEETARKVTAWDQFDQNAAASFFDPEWMFGLAGLFDVVIGNPPYVRQEQIKELKQKFKALYGGTDKEGRPLGAYAGTADLYVYFIQRGIELLKPGGAFCYITSNKWYRAKYGKNLRDWMNRHCLLPKILDFGDADVFDAIAYPTILVATRRSNPVKAPSSGDIGLAMNWQSVPGETELTAFPERFNEYGFEFSQKNLSPDGWQLEPQHLHDLLEHLRAAGTPLGPYVEDRFYRGVLTGLNQAFVIDGETRQRLIKEDKNASDIIKPFLRGRDVKRWQVEPKDRWLIKIPSSENTDHPWSGKDSDAAELSFKQCYPSIYQRFQQYREDLISRSDQGHYFWELRSCAYWNQFSAPKILYPDIYLHQSYAWNDGEIYGGNTCYFIPTSERWLTGLLNSSLVEWFYSQISNRVRGGYLRAFSEYIQQIPIPRADDGQKTAIDSIVRAIVEDGSTPQLEQLINGFVFELFFQDEMHSRGIRLFEQAEKSGLNDVSQASARSLSKAVKEFTARCFDTSHPLYAMLFDLQALDFVRTIEGKD